MIIIMMNNLSEQILPSGTIIKSPLQIDIPTVDVTSYVFTSTPQKEKGVPLYYNAEAPSQNFSLADAEFIVKRFAKGLQRLGLRAGDRILLYSGNKLSFPIVFWSVPAASCVFTASSPAASAPGTST